MTCTGFSERTKGSLLKVAITNSGATTPLNLRYQLFFNLQVQCCGYLFHNIDSFFYTQLDSLMGSLNEKGERERALKRQLEKRYNKIS